MGTRPTRALSACAATACALAVVAGGISSVRAGAPRSDRVAVFAFEGFSLPGALEMAPLWLMSEVREGMSRRGDVIEPPLLLRDAMGAGGCGEMDGGCAERLGALFGVGFVVVGKLTSEGGLVRVRVRLFDAVEAKLEREVDKRVAATEADLRAAFSAIARELAPLPPGGLGSVSPIPPESAAADPVPVTVVPGAGFTPPSAESFAASGPSGDGSDAVAAAAPVSEPVAVPAVSPPPRGTRVSAPGVALTIAGVGVLIASGFTGSRTRALHGDLDAIPRDTIEHFGEASAIDRRGHAMARVTAALLMTGVVAAGAGIAMVTLRVVRGCSTAATVTLDARGGGIALNVRRGGLP